MFSFKNPKKIFLGIMNIFGFFRIFNFGYFFLVASCWVGDSSEFLVKNGIGLWFRNLMYVSFLSLTFNI